MEAEYAIYPSYVRFRLAGALDLEIVASLIERTARDADFDDRLGFLWDVQELEPRSVNPADIPVISDLAKQISSPDAPGKVAFLVKDRIGYGISRMAAAHAETPQRLAGVFLDESEAVTFVTGDQR